MKNHLAVGPQNWACLSPRFFWEMGDFRRKRGIFPKMEYFHRRWMPSNKAKNDWIARVRKLDIDILAPQHGALFRGDMVHKFLDWFERLEVGIASNR